MGWLHCLSETRSIQHGQGRLRTVGRPMLRCLDGRATSVTADIVLGLPPSLLQVLEQQVAAQRLQHSPFDTSRGWHM